MKPSVHELENLLALKRDERPEEGYWQDFLCEFHQRQRERATRRSKLGVLWSQLSAGFADLGPSKWVYGAGLAYAALTVAFFLTPRDVDSARPAAAPVNREIPAPVPVPPVEQLDELDLDPSTQGKPGEQVF